MFEERLNGRRLLEPKRVQHGDVAADQVDKKGIADEPVEGSHPKGLAEFPDSPQKQRDVEQNDEQPHGQLWKQEVDRHGDTRNPSRDDIRFDIKQSKTNGGDQTAKRDHRVIKYDA